MTTQLAEIEVITLFVKDIPRSREFYSRVFARPIVYEDDVSFVLQFENLMVNCLQLSEGHEVVEPNTASIAANNPQFLLTIRVEDTDAVCTMLDNLGIKLLNGPVDRPWGRRTAAFADPSGHVWEIAQVIDNQDGAA